MSKWTVWKVAVPFFGDGLTTVALPPASDYLCTRVQNNTLVAYFRVANPPDKLTPKNSVARVLYAVGTGWDVTQYIPSHQYLGTFDINPGLVFHVFGGW